jgi:hypothetical protein
MVDDLSYDDEEIENRGKVGKFIEIGIQSLMGPEKS